MAGGRDVQRRTSKTALNKIERRKNYERRYAQTYTEVITYLEAATRARTQTTYKRTTYVIKRPCKCFTIRSPNGRQKYWNRTLQLLKRRSDECYTDRGV